MREFKTVSEATKLFLKIIKNLNSLVDDVLVFKYIT